ncbi:hypothetical protein SAMN05216383_11311 [Prevotella sp. KH2C16]|nr:hypothetical protein SAMN05216383_11311 [Prevotella sp. KH2C16]
MAQTKILVTVGGKSFTAALADNSTASAFEALLPLTLDMAELNGNEKYNYMSRSLPTNTIHPNTIQEGDIMLYGSTCVVLFYKTFSTSYAYSCIGRIDNASGLASALGRGSATVSFSLLTTGVPAATAKPVSGKVYNLEGQEMEHPREGVYIVDGKKCVIR